MVGIARTEICCITIPGTRYQVTGTRTNSTKYLFNGKPVPGTLVLQYHGMKWNRLLVIDPLPYPLVTVVR